MGLVYLAGGFKSDWGKKVIIQCPHLSFINPKEKEFREGERIHMNVNEYGKWDLHYIRQSDIVFVYGEKDNPSCIGFSVEAGYAKGLGKTVILVLEPNNTTIKDKNLAFITQVADIVFDNLESGIDYLRSFRI